MKQAVTVKASDPGDENNFRRYELDNKGPVKAIGLDMNSPDQHIVTISIGDAGLADQAILMLKHHKLDPEVTNPVSNSATKIIRVRTRPDENTLATVANALSNVIDLGQGHAYYPLLDGITAAEIGKLETAARIQQATGKLPAMGGKSL